MSRRTERLSSLIQRIIAGEIQRGLGDPRIAPLTSITRVEISADLSSAKIFVSVFGEDAAGRSTIRALASAAGHLRAVLADEISIRTVPRLTFKLDESLKRGFEVTQMIEREMAELNARDERAASEGEETEQEQEAVAGAEARSTGGTRNAGAGAAARSTDVDSRGGAARDSAEGSTGDPPAQEEPQDPQEAT